MARAQHAPGGGFGRASSSMMMLPGRPALVGFILGFVLCYLVSSIVMPGCTESEVQQVAAAIRRQERQRVATQESTPCPQAAQSRVDDEPDVVKTTTLPPTRTTPASLPRVRHAVTPLLAMLHFSADKLFEALIRAPTKKRGLVVEIGSYDGLQAKLAYDVGHQVLVLEPSPVNFPKVGSALRKGLRDPDGRLSLLQVAASSKNGSAMFYTNRQGSPGDHISLDGNVHEGEEVNYKPHKSYRTDVPTMLVDDIIGDRRIYFLKVDVQGHELHVFDGCRKLLRERRVAYAMFEFQPKQLGPRAPQLIEELNDMGYDTFSLMPWWSRGDGFSDEFYSFPTVPTEFAQAFRPDHSRGMGEWTDILAVCRGDDCITRNHEARDTFLQPFDEEQVHHMIEDVRLRYDITPAPAASAAWTDNSRHRGGGGGEHGRRKTNAPRRTMPPKEPPAVDDSTTTSAAAARRGGDGESDGLPRVTPAPTPAPRTTTPSGEQGTAKTVTVGPRPSSRHIARAGVVHSAALKRRTPLPSPQGTGADAPAGLLPADDDGPAEDNAGQAAEDGSPATAPQETSEPELPATVLALRGNGGYKPKWHSPSSPEEEARTVAAPDADGGGSLPAVPTDEQTSANGDNAGGEGADADDEAAKPTRKPDDDDW